VIVIEHNLEVIKMADHIIDIGPEGGRGGGELLFQGPPEEIIKAKNSFTGEYLKEELFNKSNN
jgi:excinuclease ABC subunit A